ncbi:MAG: 3-deoxy-D-manno-octulosonic acid transferase [Rhodospirillales bacterium]|nr:3-deoxy-D-manno-octulosonic acid transferase [Rhodospirillales bacterium]
MRILAIYRVLTVALGPLIVALLAVRRWRGKEDPRRFAERLGRASLPRPKTPLAWLHAASVGEAASLLALIDRLERERPGLALLVTTGTVTSAKLLGSRLQSGRTQHQFVPVDRPAYVGAFLAHWRPDLAIWVESELWPNLIAATQARGVPTILLNARISRRSYERWRRFPSLLQPLLQRFAVCLAQDAAQAARLNDLGATAETVGDLKSAAAPLPVDPAELERLRTAIGERPLWLAASTHPGEEEIAGKLHRSLKLQHAGLLTIVAPRHPARGDSLAAAFVGDGLTVARRSRGEAIAAGTDIYLADTLGEMGLLYRIAEIVFVGGSLTPVGGHNPVEPALLGCAILHGPDMTNCAAVARALDDAGGALQITGAVDLGTAIDRLLGDPEERQRRAAAAAAVAAHDNGVLDRILERLGPWLDRLAPRRAPTGNADNDRACA